MSIAKKGLRKIIVDGEPFIWLIRRKAAQSGYPNVDLRVAVEHAEEPGSTLVIRTNRIHPESWSQDDSEWILFNEPVTPVDVARWVKQAIQIGWQPKQSGASFEVRVVGKRVEKFAGY